MSDRHSAWNCGSSCEQKNLYVCCYQWVIRDSRSHGFGSKFARCLTWACKLFRALRLAIKKKMPGFGGCLRFLFWVVSLFLVLGALFFLFVHDSLGHSTGNSPQPLSINNLHDCWRRLLFVATGWINSQSYPSAAAGMHGSSPCRSPVATHELTQPSTKNCKLLYM